MAEILQFPKKDIKQSDAEQAIINFIDEYPFKFWAKGLREQLKKRFPWIEEELSIQGALQFSSIAEPNKLSLFIKEYKKVDWANYGFWLVLRKIDQLTPLEIRHYISDWSHFMDTGPNRTIKQYWDTWEKLTKQSLPVLPYFPIYTFVDDDNENEHGWFLGGCEYGLLKHVRPFCQGVICALIAFQDNRPTMRHIIIALREYYPDIFEELRFAGIEMLHMLIEKRRIDKLSWLNQVITCYGHKRHFDYEHIELFDRIYTLCGMVAASQRCIKHENIRNHVPGMREWINIAIREIWNTSLWIWEKHDKKVGRLQ